MKILLYTFAALLFIAHMRQLFLLRPYILRGDKSVKLVFIFPINLRQSISSKADRQRISFWRAIALASFIGLLLTFGLLLSANLATS